MYFARYFVFTRFWPFAKLFLHNDAIVRILRSFLQCIIQVTNVTLWENGRLLYAVTNHAKAVAFVSQKILPVTKDVDSHS